MDNFNSGDHVFSLHDITAKQEDRGSSLTMILDVPYTEELCQELETFRWKDVKVDMQSADGKSNIQGEFYIADIKPKAFKEGPRIRFCLRMPYERKIDIQAVKLRWHDVKFTMEIIQKEIDFEQDQAVNE